MGLHGLHRDSFTFYIEKKWKKITTGPVSLWLYKENNKLRD
jgi:hypothetical protein